MTQALYDAARALVAAAHKTGGIAEADYQRLISGLDGEDPLAAQREAEAAEAAAQAERDELARLQAKYPEIAAAAEAAERQRLADLQARAQASAQAAEAERQAAITSVPGGGFRQAQEAWERENRGD